MNMNKNLLIPSVFCVLMFSGCFFAEPSGPENISSPTLEEVSTIDGQDTTNLIINDTESLGLRVDEDEDSSDDIPLDDRVASIQNPTLRVTSPTFDSVHFGNSVEVNYQVQGAQLGGDIELVYVLDSNPYELVSRQGSFSIQNLSDGLHTLRLQLMGTSDKGLQPLQNKEAFWVVQFYINEKDQVNSLSFTDSILTVYEPRNDARYTDVQVPFRFSLVNAEISPGAGYIEYVLNGEPFNISILDDYVLDAQPGENTFEVHVYDSRGMKLAGEFALYQARFFVD